MSDNNSRMSRKWCLTVNNYTEDDCNFFKDYVAEYIVAGLEVGEKGTPHIQGYFRLKNKKSFSKIKKEFPRAHISIANGNDVENKVYCLKDGKTLTERGSLSEQGKRNDLHGIKDMIENGESSMRQMIGSVSNLQGIRTAEKLLIYLEPARNWECDVYWFWGRSGTGKSRRAFETYPDAYICMDTIKWWEGYDAHEEVIIDDMRIDFCSYKQLLRLLDRYAYRVEYKGGSRQLRAKTIVITSCYSPDQLYSSSVEDNYQLIRRITETIEFV